MNKIMIIIIIIIIINHLWTIESSEEQNSFSS